jgi:hypothetical protein
MEGREGSQREGKRIMRGRNGNCWAFNRNYLLLTGGNAVYMGNKPLRKRPG